MNPIARSGSICAALLLSWTQVAGQAEAASFETYTTRAAFDAAVGTTIIEDFESFLVETPFHTIAVDVGDFVLSMAGTPATSLNVIDPAPAQIPSPESVERALSLLQKAERPLIILGKGASYSQADDEIRALVERTGIPFLPMSMGKGILPDTHEQCTGAARSLVLKEADVVMLIGARLNWLLSQGKGKPWGGRKQFIQIDIEPTEMDSNG